MDYLRVIVAPFISTALSFLVGYLLLSPNGFNLPAKAEKHYAEQDKIAAEEKYVAVDNKSMKWGAYRRSYRGNKQSGIYDYRVLSRLSRYRGRQPDFYDRFCRVTMALRPV